MQVLFDATILQNLSLHILIVRSTLRRGLGGNVRALYIVVADIIQPCGGRLICIIVFRPCNPAKAPISTTLSEATQKAIYEPSSNVSAQEYLTAD